ncbi:MAG TPA: hypothetical protein VGL39_05045 [Jatrophihabitantaceae bacterium]
MAERRYQLSGAPIGHGGVAPSLVDVGGYLTFPGGYLTFPGGEFTATGGGEPDITISVRVENGEPYLAEVRLHANDARTQITDDDLRIFARQHAHSLVEWIMANLPGYTDGPDGLVVELKRDAPETYAMLRSAVTRARHRASAERKAEHLREVAAVYRAGGRKGVEAVVDRFGYTHRTAQLWIARAREAGELGAAIVGKAGER